MGKLYDFSINPKKRDISLFEKECKICKIEYKIDFIPFIMRSSLVFDFIRIFVENVPNRTINGENLYTLCINHCTIRNLEYILTLDSCRPSKELDKYFPIQHDFLDNVLDKDVEIFYNILFNSNKFVGTQDFYFTLIKINNPNILKDFQKSDKFLQINTCTLNRLNIPYPQFETDCVAILLADLSVGIDKMKNERIKLLLKHPVYGSIIRNRLENDKNNEWFKDFKDLSKINVFEKEYKFKHVC